MTEEQARIEVAAIQRERRIELRLKEFRNWQRYFRVLAEQRQREAAQVLRLHKGKSA